MDLMQEYYTWQNPERANQFSYCQYPFILSIVAKQHILTKDSEQQASLQMQPGPWCIIMISSNLLEKSNRKPVLFLECLASFSPFAH